MELERRRRTDNLDVAALVSDIHELRSLMSAAAQMMRSFDLPQYGGRMKWGPDGEPDNSRGLTPQEYAEAADADLVDAFEHLQLAAGNLTSARRRLAVLN